MGRQKLGPILEQKLFQKLKLPKNIIITSCSYINANIFNRNHIVNALQMSHEVDNLNANKR